MTPTEATRLLTVIAGQDPRVEVNAATALSWSYALPDLSLEIALQAYQAVIEAGEAYRITPSLISKHSKPYLRRLAYSVRSAKLRHLVPQDWPDTRPLPDEARAALARAWAETNDPPDAIGGASTRELDA